MLASTDDFRVLIHKYLRDQLSKEEESQLQEMIANSPLHKATFDSLTDKEELRKQLIAFDQSSQEWDARETRNMNPAYQTIRRQSIKMYWYAAASVLLIATAGIFYFTTQNKPAKETVVSNEKPVVDDVPAGSQKATLTLADNSVVELDPNKKDALQQGSTTVVNENGQLLYKPDVAKANTDFVLTNTLTTPAGGYYKIKLPDGSVAWLNAVSSLQYPTRFTGKERRVKLVGEGYFEVVKDASKPFIVEVDNMEVKVLGTKFNIKAYTNEVTKTTTLLEGRVLVQTEPNKQQILQPNQRAITRTNGSSIKVEETDALLTIAWVKGNFYFDQASLSEVMHQLERWYDISFLYSASVIEEAGTFQGTIERSWPLSKVLRTLERLGKVTFEQNGKTISVSKAMNL